MGLRKGNKVHCDVSGHLAGGVVSTKSRDVCGDKVSYINRANGFLKTNKI